MCVKMSCLCVFHVLCNFYLKSLVVDIWFKSFVVLRSEPHGSPSVGLSD